jgi:cysteine desulfurase
MPKPIYLDYNATTPIDPEVLDAMLPYLREHFGNPSSAHPYGREAHAAIDHAREQIASLLNCDPGEILFTSGGTESNNMVIKGVAEICSEQGKHIITSAIEHPAILEPCEWLAAQGFEITILPVDAMGRVSIAALESTIRPDTILISIMLANNEVGTIQPIAEISAIAHRHGVTIHTDAAQAIGKIPVDVQESGVDFLTVAGHKLYAPKGIGVLYLRSGVQLPKFMHGAGHEGNRRAGTENVPYIAGLGQAAAIAQRDLVHSMVHMKAMRERLHSGLRDRIPDQRHNGDLIDGLPNTLSLSFRNVEANTLLAWSADRVAVSAGAACHADSITVSKVLQAMNVPLDYAMGTVRFSVGKMTTADEIDEAVQVIAEAVASLRA